MNETSPSPWATTMRIAEPVAEPLGDVGAKHGVEQVLERPARREGERLAPIAVMLEVVARRAEDAKALMAVAERERHDPGDLGPGGDVLIALPGDVGGGVADAEHRVEQELHSPPLRAPTIRSVPEIVSAKLSRAPYRTFSTPRRSATLTAIASTVSAR